MKKFPFRSLLIPLLLFILFFTYGCSDGSSAKSGTKPSTQSTAPKETIRNDRLAELTGNPDKFKGYNVELVGVVFTNPEVSNGNTAFQMFANPKKSEGNIAVVFKGTSPDIGQNSFVRVIGTVKGKFEGENLFGGKVVAVAVEASKVEKISPLEAIAAISPALKSVEVNKTINQSGYTVTLKKVDFAADETRLYLTVANSTSSKIYFYTHSAKALQNGRQFETESVFLNNFPQIPTEILPGATAEGVLLFPAMDINAHNVRFVLEGSSDNFDITIQPFTFDISW